MIDIATLDPESTIVVATGNAHKLTEIEAILGESPALEDVRFGTGFGLLCGVAALIPALVSSLAKVQ